MTHDVIVVGAGVSGLALARKLLHRGQQVLVLERSRGVGGRCATRRIEGQPVDHGIAFLHGRTGGFLSEVDAVGEVVLPDWPRVRDGQGTPCRPEAFDGQERRLAFAGGVNRFAKHLARGVEVRLQANVAKLRVASGAWELMLDSGETLCARAVALTLPAPSAMQLLRTAAPLPAVVSAVLPLVGLVRMLPCLTVIARYPKAASSPSWDVSLPRGSQAIHTLLHDSSKRTGGGHLTLVLQARPAYSRAHLDERPESWTHSLLVEAADLHGAWLARPESIQSHVWREARVDPGSELVRPVAVRLEGGPVLGFAGDGFHEAGGVEGAYLSGIALAERLAGQGGLLGSRG